MLVTVVDVNWFNSSTCRAFFIMRTSRFDSQSATSEASLPAKCFSKFRIDLDTDPEGDGTWHDVSTSAEKDHPA